MFGHEHSIEHVSFLLSFHLLYGIVTADVESTSTAAVADNTNINNKFTLITFYSRCFFDLKIEYSLKFTLHNYKTF